jgi:hypothetical protein
VLLPSCSDIFVLCHICQRMQQRYILGGLPSFDALQEGQIGCQGPNQHKLTGSVPKQLKVCAMVRSHAVRMYWPMV